MNAFSPVLSHEIPYQDTPIDDMPLLSARLGKARVDRIRYAANSSAPRPRSARNTPNFLLQVMQHYTPFRAGEIDDIVEGIARLDHHGSGKQSVPLSVTRLYNILQCMPVINTHEISLMLGVDTRQAQKYLKAAKLCLFHIQRHINNNNRQDSSDESLE